MTKTVNLNVRVQRISSTSKAHILSILHGNVLINMWHNYSRGEKNHYDVINISVEFFCICLMLMTL